MTKIAITGPVTGTGTYTLRAPDTASTLDFELPTVGTHLASAQADGMPLGPGGDPVVESGSNSDGEWTRWADGTQVVSKFYSLILAADTAWGSGYTSVATSLGNWATPFIASPKRMITHEDGYAAVVLTGGSTNTSATSSGDFQLLRMTAVAANNIKVNVSAIGRWK